MCDLILVSNKLFRGQVLWPGAKAPRIGEQMLTQHAQAEWVVRPLQGLHQSRCPCLSDDPSPHAKVSTFFARADRLVETRENQSRPDPRAGEGKWVNCSTIGLQAVKDVVFKAERTDEVQVFF